MPRRKHVASDLAQLLAVSLDGGRGRHTHNRTLAEGGDRPGARQIDALGILAPLYGTNPLAEQLAQGDHAGVTPAKVLERVHGDRSLADLALEVARLPL